MIDISKAAFLILAIAFITHALADMHRWKTQRLINAEFAEISSKQIEVLCHLAGEGC